VKQKLPRDILKYGQPTLTKGIAKGYPKGREKTYLVTRTRKKKNKLLQRV